MCQPGQQPVPATAADATAMARAGLAWLASADTASLTTAEQADCLRALAQAESIHTAARARVLYAFTAQAGYEDDGHRSPRTWLAWQTRVGGGAAAIAVKWMQRLAAHPAVADALAAGEVSESWARQICEWSDVLPGRHRRGADAILLAAARGGAELRDLGALAEEMVKQAAGPDRDGDDDGFRDRSLSLGVTMGGAGRLRADLTPQATAALQAVLEALGKPAGPEDLRSKWQRQHDALEEACRRLIGSGCLPQRGGQPAQIQLHMTLDQLRGLPGAQNLASSWPGAPAGPGYDCDATIVPVVTGHIDPAAVDRLAAALLRHAPGDDRDAAAARRKLAERATRQLIIARAADVLSGPAGLAAHLRTGLLDGPAAASSLPLDIGHATDTIPAHLRRLVIARDRHCQFPGGCDQPAAACQPHHIIPKSNGGKTCLANLLLLCTFHHLIAIHRWGWQIALNPDGTVTATSPDRTRTLHSHSPPAQAA